MTLLVPYLREDDGGHQIPQQPRAVSLDGLHERLLEEQRHQLVPFGKRVGRVQAKKQPHAKEKMLMT